MMNSEICTRQCGVREIFSCNTLEPRVLGKVKLNTRLGYDIIILDNWQNNCTRGVIGYRRVLRKMCSEWIDWI